MPEPAELHIAAELPVVASAGGALPAPPGGEPPAAPAPKVPLPPGGDEPSGTAEPTLLMADRLSGITGVETVAEGNAMLSRPGRSVRADRLTYRHIEDEVEADGNVRLDIEGSQVSGPRMKLRLEEQLGFIESPRYSLRREPDPSRGRKAITGYGEAARIDFEGENRFRLTRATYTTCGPDNPDWYATARDLSIDMDSEEGEARDARLVFKDTPILYTPYLGFGINERRKSGLLPPTIGSSNQVGVDITMPYYWNIAPNRDATISPRLMSRRGLQLGGEFRYLEPSYEGRAQAEWLPSDQVLGKSRSAYAIDHRHAFNRGLTGSLSLNGVSDDTYYTDLSSRISSTSQRFLLRQGIIDYADEWWRATLTLQRYQTLVDPTLPPVDSPYEKRPQLKLAGMHPGPLGVEFGLSGDFVSFDHPTLVTGRRLAVYPHIARAFVTPGFYFTPKLGVHFSRYDGIERQAAGVPEQVTRNLPVVSLDSALTFERETSWAGNRILQTLEPRLFYLYVPYRDQADIPVFDTAPADFNFAQIFAENVYSGFDRIADANQLTAAITSRFIDPQTGREHLRAAIGQRFHFRDQLVTLPGESPRTNRSSDLVGAISGRLLPALFVDASLQYSASLSRTERFVVAARYQPQYARVVNAAYRFQSDAVKEIDLSTQWPLAEGWYGVGRYNYSIRDSRIIQAVGGLEYNAGCWVLRGVVQRFAAAEQKDNIAFFVQLELNGLSRVGSNPLELLKRNIPGYGKINQATADPVFGAE